MPKSPMLDLKRWQDEIGTRMGRTGRIVGGVGILLQESEM